MIHRIGLISIAIAPVDEAPRAGRRQAECQAVARCLDILRSADPAIPQYEDIEHDIHGAPRLPDWQISITHSRALAAVAIAKGVPPFGIDAEEWRPALLRVIPRFLNPYESARASTLYGPAREKALLRFWTIKEAVYKAAATPLLPFTAIETSPTMSHAFVSSATYALHLIPHPASAITLAIKQ